VFRAIQQFQSMNMSANNNNSSRDTMSATKLMVSEKESAH